MMNGLQQQSKQVQSNNVRAIDCLPLLATLLTSPSAIQLYILIINMSFASNNSRNVANLLRYEQLQPLPPNTIPPKRNLPTLNQPPTNQPPSRERQEIPIDEVFTPEELNQRQPRKRTPLNGNMRSSSREQDNQVESMRVRLEQIVQFYEGRQKNMQTNMIVRLNQLENLVMKEMPRLDNNTMLSTDLLTLKEVLNDVRKQQQYQASEINAIKALNNQRNGADAMQQLGKEKEKSTVLFMEMVRLGDTVEKMSEYMNSMARTYQSKYQDLENKLSNSEKNLMFMSQKTSSGSEVLNELGDKLMSRLATSQSNLLLLGKEQVKDKEAISKLMAQNDRMGEDLQLLLRNMQADFQSKLENRVQETVNRLMMEHEQRIRSQQEIKKNLDLRERISAQKQMSDKMETKAKYDSMDNLVRNELNKKEESIRSLHKAMEDQFRSLMGELQAEGARRKEQESTFRGEIKRVQESLRKEYDLYKSHQGELVDKITEMIKSEIEVRLTTQLDLKKLTSSIAHEIVNDVNNLKEALSSSNKKLSYAIREASSESADRAGQLSHYIDNQIKQVKEVVTEKYSKMKSIFTKLAEQLKEHLLKTQQNRKSTEGRLTAIQQDFDKLKNEVNGQIDQFYNDLQARLKEEKEFVETVVFKKNNDLTVRVSKLQEYTNQYFEVLKDGIEGNKDLLSKKLSGINEHSSGQNQEEMKSLRNIIFQIKRITEELKSQNDQEFQELRKDLQASENRNKDQLFGLETKLNQRLSKSGEKEKQLQQQLNELSVKVNSLRADSNSPSNSINENKLKKISDDVKEANQRVTQNEQLLEKIADEIKVLRAQINTLDGKIK